MKKVQRGSERRELARELIVTRQVSMSQACRVASIDRQTYRYEPKKKQDDTMVENLLKTLSVQYPTYGFEKLFNLIRLKNYSVNHKHWSRIYCDLKLNLKIKSKKRLAPRTKFTLIQPQKINECWSLDFMSDALNKWAAYTYCKRD